MGTGQLLIKFAGDVRGFFDATKKVKGEVGALKTDLGSIGSIWTAVTAGAIAVGARKVFSEFAAAEDAAEGLRSMLRATGRDGVGAVNEITAAASALQDITRQGDDAIIAATEAVGILATGLSVGELAKAQEALVGLAETFFKGDINAAAQQLGKTIGGNVNTLSRYGIEVNTAASESEKLAQILGQTGAMFEVAKDKAKTNMGVLVQAKNAWGDILELIGEVGVTALTADGPMGGLVQRFKDAQAFINNNKAALVAWATVAVKAAEAVIAPFRMLLRILFNVGQQVGEVGNWFGALLARDFGGMRDAVERMRQNWADMGDALDDNKDSWAGLLDALKDAAKGGDLTAKATDNATTAVQRQTAAVNKLTEAQKRLLKDGFGPSYLERQKAIAAGTLGWDADRQARYDAAQEDLRTGRVTLFKPTAQARGGAGGGRTEGQAGTLSEVGAAMKGLAKGIGSVLSALNPWAFLLEAVQRALGDFLVSMTPIIEVLARALMPILKALFPVFKMIVIAATYVGEVFFTIAGGVAKAMGWLIRAIGKAIDALPFVSGKSIIDAGQKMMDLGKGFTDSAKELGKARDEIKDMEWVEATDGVKELGAAAAETAASLRNVPSGVKVNLMRFRASEAQGGGPAPMKTGGDSVVQITGPITVTGVQDPAAFYREMESEARRVAARGGSTVFALQY